MTAHSIPVEHSGVANDVLPQADAPLTIVTWNIGYSGLGKESDFRADGGRMVRAPSKSVVDKNAEGITQHLKSTQFDVLIMQELATAGFMTRGVDVKGRIQAALPGYTMLFSADVKTKFLPRSFSVEHGLATLSRVRVDNSSIAPIPEEPARLLGLFKRKYHVQVTDLLVAGKNWSIINIHLSAFDEGADVRMQQLEAIIRLGVQKYDQGNAVIIGGDWNMRLMNTDFPYTSNEKALFWIHDLPKDILPSDWRLTTDPTGPTVRTNERPYKSGENYTTIIDGFLVSPNVKPLSVDTQNLDFEYTDHHPVKATFERID